MKDEGRRMSKNNSKKNERRTTQENMKTDGHFEFLFFTFFTTVTSEDRDRMSLVPGESLHGNDSHAKNASPPACGLRHGDKRKKRSVLLSSSAQRCPRPQNDLPEESEEAGNMMQGVRLFTQ